jgi:ribosomal protein L29
VGERTLRELSIDELRDRVQEAEKLLRVARQLAQDELRSPETSGRAKDRIAAICSEVNALFPGVGQQAPEEPPQEVAEEGGTLDSDDSSEAEPDAEDGEEWDIDYAKLRLAIQNPELMNRFPEAERATFKAMAEQLIEAHDRAELYARVTAGFEQLEQTTRDGAEEVRKQLAVALTFEELKARTRQ